MQALPASTALRARSMREQSTGSNAIHDQYHGQGFNRKSTTDVNREHSAELSVSRVDAGLSRSQSSGLTQEISFSMKNVNMRGW